MRRLLPKPLAARLRDAISIDASPDVVWMWLSSLASHYGEWHPDHVSAAWIRGDPNEVGSRLEVVERLGGHRERLVFEVTAIDSPRRFEYRIVGVHSAFIPGGRFVVEPRNHHSEFVAEVDLRLPRLSGIVFRRRVKALRMHMREEGRSLKRVLEAAPSPTDRRPESVLHEA